VAKRWFAYRLHRTKIGDLQSAELRQGIFMHTLILRTSATEISFYVFVGRAFRPADPLAAGPSG
jgi:hypothetical protein